LGSSSKKETQSGKDSCTSCSMHKTRSCAHTSHKDRVSGVSVCEGRSQKSTVEEVFQGLDSFERDLERNSGAENGQDDYAWKAQASELTLVCWSRKGSLGSGNPRHQQSGAVGETCYGPSYRIDLQGFRVLQTLSRRKRGGRREFRVWQTLTRRKREGGNTRLLTPSKTLLGGATR